MNDDLLDIPDFLRRKIEERKPPMRDVGRSPRKSIRIGKTKKTKRSKITYTKAEFGILYHHLLYTKTAISKLKKAEVKRIVEGDIAPHIWRKMK